MNYLHIGRHKTGTSALQRFLHGSRRRLARKGFDYPEPLRHHSAHHDLALAFNAVRLAKADEATRAAAESERARLGELLAAPGDRIFSSEAFQNLSPEILRGVFPQGETTVIVYLREQLDYLLSAYAQMIQAQSARTPFVAYAAAFNIDHGVFLDRWAAVFGKANLRARVYDRELLREGDVRADFVEALGLKAWRFRFPQEQVNPSIGPELIEFKGVLNALLPEETQKQLRLYNLLARMAQHAPARMAVSPGFAERFRGRFTEANARLARDYGLPPLPQRDLGRPAPSKSLAEAVDAALETAAAVAPSTAKRLRKLLPADPAEAGLEPLLPRDWGEAEAALSRRSPDAVR